MRHVLCTLLTLLALTSLHLLRPDEALAQTIGDGGQSVLACGHLNPFSPEGKQCKQVCVEQPASGDCLVFLRFGPPGIDFIKRHDPKATPDIVAAAKQEGMAPEDATALRWFLTTDQGWADPSSPTNAKGTPTLDQWRSFSEALDALSASREQGIQEQMDAARKLLTVAEASFGPQDPQIITVLVIVAGFMTDGGMMVIATPYYKRLLELTSKHLPADHPEHLMTLTRYGSALMEEGDRARGEPMMQQGLAGMRALWGPYHPNMIHGMKLAYSAYMSVGEYARARLHAEDTLRASLRMNGLISATSRRALLMLAEALTRLGDLTIAEAAISACEMMLVGRMEEEDAIDYYLARGRMEEARAREADRGTDMTEATKRYKAALRAFSAAYKLGEKTQGKSTPVTPEVMLGLAPIFARSEKDKEKGLKQGLDSLDVALKLRIVRLGMHHVKTIEVREQMARLKQQYGTRDEAIVAYQMLLKELESYVPSATHLFGRAHRALAMLLWGKGEIKEARLHAMRSLQLLGGEFARDTARGLDDIQGQIRLAFDGQRVAMDEAVSLLQSDAATPQLFDALLSWHGVVTRAAINQRAAWRQRARLTGTLPQDHDTWREAMMRGAEMLPQAQQARARLEAAGVQVRDEQPTTLKDLCREVARRDATLVQYLFYVYHERDAAAGKAVALENRALALLLDRRCKPVRVELGSYAQIEPLLNAHRDAVLASEQCYAQRGKALLCQVEFAAQDTTGAALRARVWDPIEARLGKANKLLVVPDGKLVQVALDALPDRRKAGGYLVERYEMTTVPYTAALLQRPEVARSAEAEAEAFVVGDVNYEQSADMMRAMSSISVCSAGTCEVVSTGADEGMLVAMRGKKRAAQRTCGRDGRWGKLTTEAMAVAELLSGPFGEHVFLARGDGATEPLVRLQLPGKRLIHLATHGYWDSGTKCTSSIMRESLGGIEEMFLTLDPPLRDITRMSALVVAGANTSHADASDDGFISGAEIAELDLSEAELVVLSACETGLGTDFIGEGALGLTRGFVLAGAQNVISALWQVPSAATADLFRDTYTAMTRKKKPRSPAGALREAKLLAIKRARAQGAPANALMWGAFVQLQVRD
jgi:CHAT domain-containing protein